MAELFQQLLHWVEANPGWAGAVVFLMAFAESMAIVGMVVPGVAILFTVGALIGAGALDFWQMVAWAVVGAILGDGLSFWLGRRYRHQLTRLWPFSRHPETLERGIAFFEKYGGKSVVIGRFFGPVRAVIPLVAGMMAMPPGRFLAANILSALAWAPAYLLPGMAFGASLELASEVALRLVGLLVVLVAGMWFLGWLSHRLFLRLQPWSRALVGRVLALGRHHPALAQIAGALGDPRHPEARGLAVLAGLLTLAVGLLALLALIPEKPLLLADSALHLGLDQLHNSTGNHIMLALSAMAGIGATGALLFGVWLLLTAYGLRQAARHWLGGTAFAWLLALALEYAMRREPQLMTALPDIFVLRATVFFGLAAVLAATPVAHPRRWLVYSGATVLTAAVLLAQLYLGSTLPAVLFALGTGLIWVTAVGMAYRTHGTTEPLGIRQAAMVAGMALATALATALSTPAPPPLERPTPMLGTLSDADWWQAAEQRLPLYRGDLIDATRFPLNLHYAGSAEGLARRLQDLDWRPARPPAGLEWLRLLAPSTPLDALPPLPHAHRGRTARLIFTRPSEGDSRLVLYLWPGGYRLTPSGRPLWLGEVVRQTRYSWLGLAVFPRSRPVDAATLVRLGEALAHSGLDLRLARNGNLIQLAEPAVVP